MKKTFLVIFLLIVCVIAFGVPASIGNVSSETDLLKLAFEKLGASESILQNPFPKAYAATRFPLPENVPYLPYFFKDLYEEPLMIYPFARLLQKVAADFASPSYIKDDGLYQLLWYFGVDKLRAGVHRAYLHYGLEPPQLSEENPLLDAYDMLFTKTNNRNRYWVVGEYSYVNPREEAREQIEKLPLEIQMPVAKLIVHLLDAYQWHMKAIRNLSAEMLSEAFIIRDLGISQGDGQKLYTVLKDIKDNIDETLLYYASQITALSVMEAANSLKELANSNFSFDTVVIPTPLGKIVISDGRDNTHDYSNLFLLVDLGGNDTYKGTVAANSSPFLPISVVIDVSGDDEYINKDDLVATQGSGILGHGFLVDLSGNDKYASVRYSQGIGVFGTGILFDASGDDTYELQFSGQGCGYFGIGMNIDKDGDDKYYIGGFGQGYGGPGGGIGVLINHSGSDNYIAERYSDVIQIADYHSGNLINGNMVQGAGGGRRGDISDGDAWAGGLGILMDVLGDDYYYSGNWSLGIGYWFGIGICYDTSGNDRYDSVYFTQGSEAHWAMGALIDEEGDDVHNLFDEKLYTEKGTGSMPNVRGGAGLGFGWDGGTGIVIDRSGNDFYKSQIISFALGEVRSHGIFIDESGDDTYVYGANQLGMGASDVRNEYTNFTTRNFYSLADFSNNLGLFIDASGNDKYYDWDIKNIDAVQFSQRFANNSFWVSPEQEKASVANAWGIGIDAPTGVIGFLDYWFSKIK